MRVVFLLFISLLIGACSDDPTKSDPYASWTAEDFYDEAKDALAAGEFKAAIERAGGSLKDLRVAEVKTLDMKVEGNSIAVYRARLSVSFKHKATH